jgi:hypothetical protein
MEKPGIAQGAEIVKIGAQEDIGDEERDEEFRRLSDLKTAISVTKTEKTKKCMSYDINCAQKAGGICLKLIEFTFPKSNPILASPCNYKCLYEPSRLSSFTLTTKSSSIPLATQADV